MKVVAGCITSQGIVREKNQDRVILHMGEHQGNALTLACICDGIGSFDYSEIASEMVTQGISQWFDWIYRRFTAGVPESEIVEELDNAVHAANENVYLFQKENQIQIGCTMSLLLVYNENYYIFHVGDSRICILRGGQLCQLTRDEVSVKTGSDGSVKNRLANHMGKAMDLWVNCLTGTVMEEDVFILGSDGLFHDLDVRDIYGLTEKVKNSKQMQAACEQCLQLVMSRGERDNVSCIMVGFKHK